MGLVDSKEYYALKVRRMAQRDRAWAQDVITESFGSTRVVSRGRMHETQLLPGLVADCNGSRAGLLVYEVEAGQCEVVALSVVPRREGVGRTLVQALRRKARISHWSRVWLVTTNDNVVAQAFYEALEFHQVAIHRGAVAEARRLKSEIPLYGACGVAIEDEIEYEWLV